MNRKIFNDNIYEQGIDKKLPSVYDIFTDEELEEELNESEIIALKAFKKLIDKNARKYLGYLNRNKEIYYNFNKSK